MKASSKNNKRNSWKRNYEGETMSGREAVMSSISTMTSRLASKVRYKYDDDGFDWLCRQIQDPMVYDSKEEAGLFHFYRHKNVKDYEIKTKERSSSPLAVEHLLIDYDEGIHFLDVAQQFKEYNLAIYTSPSNRDGTKFRLCLELAQPLSRRVYTNKNNRKLLKEFFKEADPTSFDWHRFFYLPCVVEDRNTVYNQVISISGKAFDVETIGLDYNAPNTYDSTEIKESQPEVQKEKLKVSFMAKTDSNTYTPAEAKDVAVSELIELSDYVNDRGAGFDVHSALLRAAWYVEKAQLDNPADFMMEVIEQRTNVLKRNELFKEISRMFKI